MLLIISLQYWLVSLCNYHQYIPHVQYISHATSNIFSKKMAIMLVVSQYTAHLRAILVDKIICLLHSSWFIPYVLNITYVLNCVVFDADKLKAGVYQSSSSKHCFFQVSKNLKNKTLKVPWKFPSIRSWKNIWANRVRWPNIWHILTT